MTGTDALIVFAVGIGSALGGIAGYGLSERVQVIRYGVRELDPPD